MRLSISNIAWDAAQDVNMYAIMRKHGYIGLEIAPTRIFPDQPYDRLLEGKKWAKQLNEKEGLIISSMQSIWYGRKENIFESGEERARLLAYTKQAINFAEMIGCKNLVFGCPKNRNLPEAAEVSVAIPFFKELGDYAAKHNTTIGMEANPPIYGTNYMNDTLSVLELIGQVNSVGFKLNLDVGTMVQNNENVEELIGNVHLISHVHISEPELKTIMERKLHQDLKEILLKENYQGYVSVEMGKTDKLSVIEDVLDYVRRIFL